MRYSYGKKYRFKIVDEFGWDISKAQSRDLRLSSVLDEQSDNVLHHMYLSRPGEMDTAIAYLNLSKSELKISGGHIHAEDLIDMILEPNGYEVAPVNLIR